ncbi:MAG: hypothetical protein VB078_01645 [Clostridiaceae bacterium]|nr:hypothetical protein [Clostridiaceae bacterium]
MENKTAVFRTDFIPWIVKWGRGTNLLGVVLCFGPCIALAMMGIFPDWAAFAAAFAIQFPLVASAYIREPISYFAMLGVPGTYMSFLSGNISNLRVPCASIATKSAGIEEGTEEGTITATIGVAVSTFVSTAFLTIGVIAGAWMLEVLPPIVTAALNLLLPALFAALLANYAFMKPKLAAVVVPVCFILYGLDVYGFLTFIPSTIKAPLLPIICAFGAMYLGVRWAKQGKI